MMRDLCDFNRHEIRWYNKLNVQRSTNNLIRTKKNNKFRQVFIFEKTWRDISLFKKWGLKSAIFFSLGLFS